MQPADESAVDLSVGEFRALVAKAFRGAGYSWGLTEEASFASGVLAENGIDAGAVVTSLLGLVDGREPASMTPSNPKSTRQWGSDSEVLCPVCVGATLLDLGACTDIELSGVVEPLLIAPFLMLLVNGDQSARGFVIDWEAGRCHVGSGGLEVHGSPETLGGLVTIEPQTGDHVGEVSLRSRVMLDRATRDRLEAFAYRTYAPATSESRLGGAGADTSDDD